MTTPTPRTIGVVHFANDGTITQVNLTPQEIQVMQRARAHPDLVYSSVANGFISKEAADLMLVPHDGAGLQLASSDDTTVMITHGGKTIPVTHDELDLLTAQAVSLLINPDGPQRIETLNPDGTVDSIIVKSGGAA